jgi:TonB family protein
MSHRSIGLPPQKLNTSGPRATQSGDFSLWGKILLALSLSIILFASYSARAQEPERKVLKKVVPEYPAILRQRGIGGTVRLQVTVEANGEVSSATVLGGNAILADQAQLAVKGWRFAPGSKPTVSEVKINFDPHWQ